MSTARVGCAVAFFLLLATPVDTAGQNRPAGQAIKDAWITTQVQAKFFIDDLVKARHIDVDTNSGVVRLTGEVGSAAERQRAVTRAKEVQGVSRVVSDLKVGHTTAGTTGKEGAGVRAKDRDTSSVADRLEKEISDAWVTTKVQSKFFLDADVKGLQIDVSTNGGVVTLTGQVESEAARTKALSVAKSTDGVKQVIDKLTVGRKEGSTGALLSELRPVANVSSPE